MDGVNGAADSGLVEIRHRSEIDYRDTVQIKKEKKVSILKTDWLSLRAAL